MSKKLKPSSDNLEKIIMAKVKSNEIAMKPRWYFILGSVLMIAGLVAASIGAVFLTNLTMFLLRQHGPNGQYRLEQLVSSFPLWVPILALLGIALGIWMLRKYDFSYKKCFWVIVLGFILSIAITAFVIDKLGLNDTWSRQGPMRRFYQRLLEENPTFKRGQGRGQGKGPFYLQEQ
ncbi:MAG: hypothetical protein ACOY3M_00180 [Patescibacteria group bacterium]